MMLRREMLALAMLGGVLSAAPASACRAPAAKDRKGYARVIDDLFAAWWRRDYPAFGRHFRHPALTAPFDGRAMFDHYFAQGRARRLGEKLFNGPSAVVQVITPQGPDAAHGICGGHAWSDLVLVKFYPGLDEPVVAELRYLDGDVLAAGEWNTGAGPVPGA
jgi:hypothetical protein